MRTEGQLTLTVNGSEHQIEIDNRTTLLDALRESLGLTGTKKGCDHGQCGACTVLLGGRRVNACLVLAVAAAGRSITTVEGQAGPARAGPVPSPRMSPRPRPAWTTRRSASG